MNNKRAGTGMGFVATDPGKNMNMSYLPKCARCNSYHQESAPFRTCFTCSRPGHVAKYYRAVAIRAAPVNVVNPR
ncbi:hypothetical protein Tco_1308351, partial [Tanacetum coccineum]